ncbi:sensor histidine kinase [Pedobacter africanus]|uniref:Histidine kinase-, DNA gyrase B-, and HSP90-like ATPase n=1 Tax=Pedobacter africanus TaxID=151894 RepID=A0A1W1ZH07_9SPHI|nr:histidine kinase [Pedobacter africanus]SMC47318.1 Histidine kinase-, DNA gyrase B-, and HSP90-like ATPase [Pedobacter africanus]
MKKIVFTFLSFIIALSSANAQKGINFFSKTATGGKMLMSVDSSAKNVFYANVFQNQPNTAFNFLPQVYNVSVAIYFRKQDKPANYRYTILEDDKPIALNKSIDLTQLKAADIGEDEILRSANFGVFAVKDKVITIITYDIQKPQDVYKTIFYGKPIPRAKIQGFSQRFRIDKGVDYRWITDPKERTDLTFTEKDDELTIVKNKSDIDYLYSISIKDKQTNKTVFESTTWKYGGIISEDHQALPYVVFDKSIFKKSGDYEIIIQPLIKWEGCRNCDFSAKDIEKYITRHMLSVTLAEENYTKKELLSYTLIVALVIGLAFLVILYFNKKRNRKMLAEKEQQKNTAKLQLNSIRAQLNPHFLFNALSGIQNLMNKNETDNANKYLSKFARLTRNVLDDKELISLSQEKTLLDDYLQMEQLRFGFKYGINPSEDLDLDNIEIPSMLLQPFVENAVKHGISQKASDGKIVIGLMKQGNDLVLTVSDNGNGFDPQKKTNGLGLQLSNSRIALLNSIYKENRFTLAIQSTRNGTKISLTLTDWL